MMKYIAEMPSFTYGKKAAELLRSRGIGCELKRRERQCGYDLHIYSTADAFRILDSFGIPYTAKRNGGIP